MKKTKYNYSQKSHSLNKKHANKKFIQFLIDKEN